MSCSSSYVNNLVDITARPPALNSYRFLGYDGAETLKGFYVDIDGYQCSIVFTLTVPLGNGSNDPVGFADALAIPNNAVGVKGILSGDLYVSQCGTDADLLDDFKDNYGNYIKVLPDPEYNIFGRAV